jgi:arylamine N-acetyltransferase
MILMSDEVRSYQPEVNAYLNRIGFNGTLDGSLQTLAKLQECHLNKIPYENFDILHNIPLSLEISDLLDKIVHRGRGGYCFELNMLFSWLLKQLGYPVIDLFARFWRDEVNTPPKRRHHVLKVEVEGAAYLCDVGVGGVVPRWPVALVEKLEHRQDDEIYRLEKDPAYGWVLCEYKKDHWNWIYSFTEEQQLAKDYIMASYWCENAPDSIFRKQPMVAIRTPEGRNTIAGNEFRIFKGSKVEVITPTSKKAYDHALRRYFGIVLD